MRLILRLLIGGIVIASVCQAGSAAHAGAEGPFRFVGTPTCRNALQDAAQEYLKGQPGIQVTVDGTCGVAGLEGLVKGTADVAFIEWPLRQSERLFWPKRYQSLKEPGPEWTFAQTTLGFIVNERNRLNRLTLDQLRGIWSGTVRQWSQVGGSGGQIAVYTIHPSRHLAGALASDFLLDYRQWGKHCQERSSHQEVIGEVLKDPAAISFLVVDRRQTVPEGVKFVSLAKDASSPAVPPTTENIVLGRYPFVREYRFVFSDRTPPGAYDFCRFVQSPEAAKAFETYRLFPRATQDHIAGANRLLEMRAGKGVPIRAAGTLRGMLMQNLAVEYVTAKAAAQMQYAVADEGAAVGQFLAGKELLLLQGSPSEATLKVHSAKWAELKAEAHIIAGRAVAIVTNAANKEAFMTLDRVRSIFAGSVDQWGDSFPLAQKDIHCYGLPATDPAAVLFFSGIMRSTRCKNLLLKKDTAEIIAALALDPQGIAFVDFAAIPANNKAVRIVALSSGPKPVKPEAQAISDGTYPLSQRLMLYVLPKASETTKDFVKFILSGACDATFRQHGFSPLSTVNPRP